MNAITYFFSIFFILCVVCDVGWERGGHSWGGVGVGGGGGGGVGGGVGWGGGGGTWVSDAITGTPSSYHHHR